MPAPGRHLVTAAACALVTSLHLGMAPADSADALAGFRLPRRRMSTMHHDDHLVLVDDNARQPGQAAALLQAHPNRHLVITVAPWGRKNQRDLGAWALGLSEADTVWVLPVGDAAVPDADVRLTELIRLEGTPAYAIRPGGDLPLPPDRDRRLRPSSAWASTADPAPRTNRPAPAARERRRPARRVQQAPASADGRPPVVTDPSTAGPDTCGPTSRVAWRSGPGSRTR
ncbi:hypothetical protein U5640_12975 [Streptomyces sp. SS7]|uniref:hypothetical protein n=1 Tax=Streptomyces sp. SS7 TaxID=3108485 RepID=UPI0030EB594C